MIYNVFELIVDGEQIIDSKTVGIETEVLTPNNKTPYWEIITTSRRLITTGTVTIICDALPRERTT